MSFITNKPKRDNSKRERMNLGPFGMVFFFYLLFIFSASGQNIISTGQFISTALSDQSVTLHQKEIDFLKNTDYDLPFANQLEFRTESDEMDLTRQEYLLRFRFNTKAERDAHRNLHQSDILLEDLENKLLLEDALMDRYNFIIDYIILQREIDIAGQKKEAANDRLFVLRKKAANNSDFELTDLFKAENDIHNLDLFLLEKNGELEALNKAVKTALNKNGRTILDTTEILSIADIKRKINQLPTKPSSNQSALKRELNIENNNLEFEIEKAKNNWKIDYMQIKYSGREKLGFAREFSIGAGVEIPLKQENKLEQNDFMLDRIELENRLAIQEKNLAERMQVARQKLELKFAQYELILEQLKNSQLQYAAKNYPQRRGADPLLLLNIKSNLLKRQSDQLDIKKDIYRLYFRIIELSGKVAEAPFKNYLSPEWKPL